MTPAHPHPQPLIFAKPQFAYTAMNVATLKSIHHQNISLEKEREEKEGEVSDTTHQLCY